jgi:hypothetical protein
MVGEIALAIKTGCEGAQNRDVFPVFLLRVRDVVVFTFGFLLEGGCCTRTHC